MNTRNEILSRVLSSPHFRWMPGMLWVASTGVRDEISGRVVFDASEVPDNALPVPQDPATAGCLHALAFERWGADTLEVRVDVAPRMSGPSGMWRAVDGRGRRMGGGAIPTDILSALPGHPHTAAIVAALL